MTADDRAKTHDNRFFGVAEAIVTANGDSEGRVKVNFPWFDGGRTESEWCRVSQLYAGNGYGACFVPELGDEVLVAFVHGDMRFPVVLGGMYNGQDQPPTQRRDEDKKMVRTKAGHQLVMDDGTGSRAVELRTAGGHVVLLDDAGGKVTVTTSQGAEVVLNGPNITVKGTTVTVRAQSISLGEGAIEPLVLGQQMLMAFNSHVHPTSPVTPTSGPPVVPLTPAVLSTTTRTK